MKAVYFRDKFIPESEACVSIEDRSFRFGDGVFETLLVLNGRMYDFAAHDARLKAGLSAFFITVDVSPLEQICKELIAKNDLKEGYVRIVVSRGLNGPGAIGYMPKEAQPYFVVQTIEKPYPPFQSLSLWVAAQPAYITLPSKVNNSLHYVLAMLEAEQKGCGNALLLDSAGHICETASGNVFWFKGDVLYTPSLDLPLVPGTVRKRVIELFDGEVKEGHYTLEDLKTADEIFMTNIGMLISSVEAIKPIGVAPQGKEKTRRLRAALDAAISKEVGV